MPRDGLRRRLAVVVPDRRLPFADSMSRLKLELERDGFAAGQPLTLAKSLARVTFEVENRTGSAHKTTLRLSWRPGATYEVRQHSAVAPLVATGDWDYPWRAQIAVGASASRIEIVRK